MSRSLHSIASDDREELLNNFEHISFTQDKMRWLTATQINGEDYLGKNKFKSLCLERRFTVCHQMKPKPLKKNKYRVLPEKGAHYFSHFCTHLLEPPPGRTAVTFLKNSAVFLLSLCNNGKNNSNIKKRLSNEHKHLFGSHKHSKVVVVIILITDLRL